MDINIREKFFRHKRTTVLIGLIVLIIGSALLAVSIFAETPADCIGTDTNTQHCCTCLAITASPGTISAGDSSTLTLFLDNDPDAPSDACSANGFSSGDGTAVCSINNGVLPNTTFNDGSYNYSVSPSNTITYTATCSGIGGTKSASITITVILNQPPTATNLSVTYEQYCRIFAGQGLIGFKWTYQDEDNDNESRFDFRVNDINNVNDPNPEVGRTFEGLNNPSGTTNNQSVLIKSPLEADKITFNKTYYWWARVWDDKGSNSGWVAGPSTTTDPHAWPYPDFTWSPSIPSVDEVTQFCAVQETGVCPINESSCYDAANNLISCSGETFLWTFPAGTKFATGTSATSENPRVKFDSTGQKVVSLQITDDIGTCSITKQVGVTFPLPEWEEAAP